MRKDNASQDISLPAALVVLSAVGATYAYLNLVQPGSNFLELMIAALSKDAGFWITSGICVVVNLAILGKKFLERFGLDQQGRKLRILRGEKFPHASDPIELAAIGAGLFALIIGKSWTDEVLHGALKALFPLLDSSVVGLALVTNLTLATFFMTNFLFRSARKVHLSLIGKHRLEEPVTQLGELILGTTSSAVGTREPVEEWVSIPSRGVNGGVFVTGSVGSGKTQGTVLRYLDQLISSGTPLPAILAIDPKGTFLGEAEEMLLKHGHRDRIVRLSLKGSETFNPVYLENPLKDSRFANLAEMVRSAAVNFMGRSADSPFWDVSSTHLIRNAIAFCAAKHGYFTLLDLYRAIVLASKKNLAVDLKEVLETKEFTAEECFNIERSIDYFENEYSQLEDRLRTGIVATSTAFINQFQEFAANRVLCPEEKNLTIRSMEELIREGKVLLFDVQHPGLARSMGTFIKLHFEQAVLNLMNELKAKDMPYTTAIVIDEYQDVATCGGGGTLGDDGFMAKAREAKPAVIVATQSISSLINSVGSTKPALELIQNFRTRIACHSSDLETIRIFRELAGKDEVETETHSLSETTPAARFNALTGGFESSVSNLNESVSRSKRKEDIWTGKEFSRLRTFEAFAQVFDGIETRFLKLNLKPAFLKVINTKHETVLELMRNRIKRAPSKLEKIFAWIRGIFLASLFTNSASAGIPNVCTVASSPSFSECLDLSISGCSCGFPIPRPCALISYYVPSTFLEVWPNPRTSYFTAVPGAREQLMRLMPIPFGVEGDEDTQSFHAHAIAVPLAAIVFKAMPAASPRVEKLCFDGMSEHFGTHWKTGKGDLTQPLFLAWSAAPKACLLKGAATSATGDSAGPNRPDSPVCSYQMPKIGNFPPSSHPACNGWGTFYPRYGTYTGPASLTGALMIASRLRSLASEVMSSSPSGGDEKWQMIYPQASSCFREGQNVGLLETVKNARESLRVPTGQLKGYLFVTWSKVSTCIDFPAVPLARAAALAIPAACRGAQ